MITTIDRAGRLVIPKLIRKQAGLVSGEPLEVRFRDGRIEIEPASREVRLRERAGFWIAEPVQDSEQLRESVVRKTGEAQRGGRKPRRQR